VIARPLAPAPATASASPAGRLPAAFTPRFFILLSVGALLAIPAWIDRRAIAAMLAWDLVLLVAWLADLRRLPPPSALAVTRTIAGAASIGVETRVTIDVANAGRVPIAARLVDVIPGSMRRELPTLAIDVPAAGQGTGEYVIRPSARGDVALRLVSLRYTGPWQLAERWAAAPVEQSVRVYPDLHEARRQSMYLVRSRQVALEKRRARVPGLGRDFQSLREYRDGDEPRDVCWTATARRARMVTRVYQPERSQAVWLLVDAGRLLRARIGEHMKLDGMVNAALALAEVALASGDRVALLTYGRRPLRRILPARGHDHLRLIVETLATVSAESSEADHAAAAGAMRAVQKQRALVVWLTEVAETAGVPDVVESASRLSPQHVVLFGVMQQPDLTALSREVPSSESRMFEVMSAQETVDRREAVLRGLRQRGALALELPPDAPTATLIDQYLTVKERNLI
jgi:uncharacterized protein (DUF58 family)